MVAAVACEAARRWQDEPKVPRPPHDPWRILIDSFKRRGFIGLAIYTAQCKLSGERFSAFCKRLVREIASGERKAC